MKKTYHSACKEEKLAASRETNSKLESNNNPDAQKKLQEKVEKCQQEVQKVGLPLETWNRIMLYLGSGEGNMLQAHCRSTLLNLFSCLLDLHQLIKVKFHLSISRNFLG